MHDMEAFLAERRAALAAAEQAEAMQAEAEAQETGKGKGKANAETSKAKGKQRVQETGGDALVDSEEQARLAREAQTRAHRIGL